MAKSQEKVRKFFALFFILTQLVKIAPYLCIVKVKVEP